jgi:hypothetical protein
MVNSCRGDVRIKTIKGRFGGRKRILPCMKAHENGLGVLLGKVVSGGNLCPRRVACKEKGL